MLCSSFSYPKIKWKIKDWSSNGFNIHFFLIIVKSIPNWYWILSWLFYFQLIFVFLRKCNPILKSFISICWNHQVGDKGEEVCDWSGPSWQSLVRPMPGCVRFRNPKKLILCHRYPKIILCLWLILTYWNRNKLF